MSEQLQLAHDMHNKVNNLFIDGKIKQDPLGNLDVVDDLSERESLSSKHKAPTWSNQADAEKKDRRQARDFSQKSEIDEDPDKAME